MLLPTKMVAVRVYVHGDKLNTLLYELGRLKCFHFSDVRKTLRDVQYVETRDTLFRINNLISRLNSIIMFLKIKVKDGEFSIPTGDLNAYLNEVEKEVESIEGYITRVRSEGTELERKEYEREYAKIVEEKGKTLSSMFNTLTALKVMEEAKGAIAKIKTIYVFEGYIPEEKVKEVSACIERQMGYLKIIPEEGENIPAVETSPKALEAFHKLITAYKPLNGREIDPTIIFAFTFPLIFGMMFGDVGHGLLILLFGILFNWIRRRMPREPSGIAGYVLKGAPLLIACAITSIIFGFLYGEFFGSHEWFVTLTGLHEPLWFSPLENPMMMIKYAILIGTLHISLGLIINLVNKLLNREYKEALSPLLWIWLYWSGSYLVFTYGWGVFKIILNLEIIIPFVFLPLGAMAVSNIVLHGTEGVAESMEQFLSSISHTVSYLRIVALNMAHGLLSKLILPASPVGFIAFVLGTLFLILGLEQFLAFLHTLRLHWVEWFSKFYTGADVEYKPFTIGISRG